MNETLGKWHFWLFFIGFNGTFLPMHWLGHAGHAAPRADVRSAVPVLEPTSSSISSYVMTFAILLFFVNVL